MSALLVCSDPLRPHRPDPHFADDAAAARSGGVPVGVVDHDALCRGDAAAALRRLPEGVGTAWYRGWMLTAAQYADFAAAAASRGVTLATDAGAYRTAHELPGWYDAFREVTPHSVWQPGAAAATTTTAWAELVAPLGGGPGVVKDYVKSCKREWHDACFVPDLTDLPWGRRVAERMVALRDDALVGGVVVRRFERYAGDENGTHETRIWWLDGVPVLTSPHPDRPDVPAAEDLFPGSGDLGAIAAAVRELPCRFVVTDVARHADDERWRVVEVGDGQVSDLASGVPRGALIEPLVAALA